MDDETYVRRLRWSVEEKRAVVTEALSSGNVIATAKRHSIQAPKLGEDVTETLEVIPRSRKVIQMVREKFTCGQCEAITQPPAPFPVTPRGFVGPNLLAMTLVEKFCQHQPLRHIELRDDVVDAAPAAGGAQKFPDAASLRINFSSVRSETALRNRTFSFPRSFSRLT